MRSSSNLVRVTRIPSVVFRCSWRWVAICLFFTAAVALAQTNVRFAVIGDYGGQSTQEARVAAMIRNWGPDFILTVGDNAYSDHNPDHDAFQADVVTYYGDYIVKPSDDPEGTRTRFFPSLGNHDYRRGGGGITPERLAAYGRTFAVPAGPGGFHYYEFAKGPVRFFALDSNKGTFWDGWKPDSAQAVWCRTSLAKATERWKIVFFHHSPYESGTEHSRETHMRAWQFEKAGVTAVLAGHEHLYERVMMEHVPFFTNGLGGTDIYGFKPEILPESEMQYPKRRAGSEADLFGALFVEASDPAITFEFWNLKGEKIDHWPADAPPLTKAPAPPAAVLSDPKMKSRKKHKVKG